jgi:hypothetical protein
LAVLGQRYVKLQITELPDLTDTVVEITGKPTIDLASMTVSFPWVAATAAIYATPPPTPTGCRKRLGRNLAERTFGAAPTPIATSWWRLEPAHCRLPVNTADGWALSR